jgi:D-alanyl-D-alanine carboxypeptidase
MVSIGSISGRAAGVGNPGANIDARLAAIRQRLEPGGAVNRYQSALTVDTTPPASSLRGFDPFGEAYQAALEAKAAMPVIPSMLGASGVATYAGGYGTGGYGVESLLGTGTSGVSVGRIGGYGPMLVPSALQVYGNGRVPLEALQPIGQGGHRLFAPAADAWMAAVEAAAADGVTLRITDSYRTYDQQVDLVRRKGLYSEGGYGAVPGTSNHGWGLAVDADVNDPATLNWLRTNAHRFGYVEAVPREPWHWEFRPHQA